MRAARETTGERCSRSFDILCKKIKFSLKILWRDQGSRYSFLSVFLLIAFWVGSELRMMHVEEGYTFQSNPNNNIMIGVYVGSLLTCGVRISLIEYLLEKKKKMFSFLSCLGLSKTDYYLFHIGWNFFISSLLLLPMVVAIHLLIQDFSEFWSVCIATLFGSLANSLYIMTMALFFYSEITGLNVIGTFNFVVSIATSMIPKGSSFQFLVYSNPQSQIVDMLEKYALRDPVAAAVLSEKFDLKGYILVFICSIAVYTLLFILVENISKNEYGYYPTNSLCRRKKKNRGEGGSIGDRSLGDIDRINNYDRDGLVGNDGDRSETSDEENRAHGRGIVEMKDLRSGIREDVEYVMKIDGIVKSFEANRVLEGVSLSLAKGEMLCLLGPNGAGKSTLFNIILGNIEPDEGDVSTLSSKRISFCPQHDMAWDHLTVGEHFELVVAIQGRDRLPPRLDEKVRDLTLLEGHWNVLAKNLSGGYKRRLTLALALLSNSDIILMDEPTTALDMEIRYNIMKGIAKAKEELGTSILYTTHNLEDAENFSDNIIILSKGTVLLKGSIDELRKQFNLITIKIYNTNQSTQEKIQKYVNTQIMEECEVKVDAANVVNIRLPYDTSSNMVKHIEYFESELGLVVDMRQTSLEDVYVMNGDFENYNNIDSVGKVDLDECWKKLVTVERKISFFESYKLLLKKSKLGY